MQVEMAYGERGLHVSIPPSLEVTVIEPESVPGLENEYEAIESGLRNPIGVPPLIDLVHSGDKVVVVFSDLTRPMPNSRVLPPLLRELKLAGILDRDVVLLNAVGTHRAQSDSELRRMLGDDICDRYRIVQHDATEPTQLVDAGIELQGRPVGINRWYMDASVRILTGFIEPHDFAGFSGGPKAVMPGIADLETIMNNHSAAMLDHPLATWAVTEGNPVWDEMLRVAVDTSPTFLLNVTLNRMRQVTAVFAGDLTLAHRAGTEYVRKTAMQAVSKPFDVVVASNSGYPLDLNLYQCVKGMSAAAQIVRKGGDIILVAECREGLPSNSEYQRLLSRMGSPQELMDALHTPGFRMRDQWSAHVQALVQAKASVHIFSQGLAPEEMERALLIPCSSVEATLANLIRQKSIRSVAVLPDGPQTIPHLEPC
jgi:nickel-dependent lactate racemase